MRIKWSNIAAIALLFAAFIVTVKNVKEITAFVSSIGDLAKSGGTPEEKTIGLVAFGVVIVSVLAAMRIAMSNERDSNQK